MRWWAKRKLTFEELRKKKVSLRNYRTNQFTNNYYIFVIIARKTKIKYRQFFLQVLTYIGQIEFIQNEKNNARNSKDILTAYMSTHQDFEFLVVSFPLRFNEVLFILVDSFMVVTKV